MQCTFKSQQGVRQKKYARYCTTDSGCEMETAETGSMGGKDTYTYFVAAEAGLRDEEYRTYLV